MCGSLIRALILFVVNQLNGNILDGPRACIAKNIKNYWQNFFLIIGVLLRRMKMAKVRCRFCEFEKDQRCGVKKNMTVKVNKKRSCQSYKPNEEKILDFLDRRDDVGATVRPDWWWSRKDRRAERDKMVQKEMEQYQTTASPSKEHPLTGDLSRFTGPKPNETVAD